MGPKPQSIVAFIPLRGGSKSIPKKNIKRIFGRPLAYWVLDAAVHCQLIDRVYVATDSEEIRQVVSAYPSNKVEVIGRSEAVSTDTASTESVLLEFATQYPFESVVLIQATSPLLTEDDLEQGISLYMREEADSLVSVVRQKRFLWRENGATVEPLNYQPSKRPRRQEFDGFLVENGAFYITSKRQLELTKCRLSGKIVAYEMDEASYYEIDEPSDWEVIEKLLSLRHKKNDDLTERLSKIKLLLVDCDGVLTDAGMYYTEHGDEIKKFNTRDGMGIELLRKNGIKVGIITGENQELVRRRSEKLKVDEMHLGIKNKMEIIDGIKVKYGLEYEEIAYIGDDINDVEVICKVGFGCGVSNAMSCVKEVARFVTEAKGGEGAVREIAELILDNRK